MSFAIHFDYQKPEIKIKKKKKKEIIFFPGRDIPSGWYLKGSWAMGTLQALWQVPGTEK